MNRVAKILLLAATLWPVGYMVYFMAFLFSLMIRIPPQARMHGASAPPVPPSMDAFFTLFGLHLFTMVLTGALIALYVVHLFRTPRVAADKKVLWAVVLFMANVIAMPVYWYVYIWRRAPAPASGPTSG